MVRLAELFSKEGYNVYTYGQEKYFNTNNKNDYIKVCDSLKECIENCNIITSGVPLSKDNNSVNAIYSDSEIKLEEMYSMLENKTFIAGVIPTWFSANETIKLVDLMRIEELTILNAIPTAEGAIKIAIEETEKTIHESNILILGYGRIGKILCRNLKNLGANVYCAARKDTDISWIREGKYIPLKYNEIEEYAYKFDIVINTVPYVVLKEKEIQNLNKNCIIIELASEPGGVDKNAIEMYKIRVITAQGIPGKLAPLTAASYIKQIIVKQIGGE